MNWGHKIILSFVLFALFIGVLVYRTFQHDVNLVAEDYYKQEIEYQDHIQSVENTMGLKESIQIEPDMERKILEISFPTGNSHDFNKIKGEIHFFRPSSSKEDVKVLLKLSNTGKQAINIGTLGKGFWKIKIKWTEKEKHYYKEKTLVI